MAGETNRDLVMKTCMENGRLLKPEVPLMTIDRIYLNRAFM
jgi:hypothetical protein